MDTLEKRRKLSSVSDCGNNSWLYKSSIIQWTLMPSAAGGGRASDVFTVGRYKSIDGYFFSNAGGVYSIFPSLHLKPEVTIVEGDGTNSTPFVLG